VSEQELGATTGVTRSEDGRFVKGVSGNDAGRPEGKKNVITGLKQDLEIAVREHLAPQTIKDIIDSMVAEALNGSVGAAKLLLDKAVSNAKDVEDVQKDSGGFTIEIRNLTLTQPGETSEKPVEGETIDHEDTP
jgi:hypothetical protein